MTGLILLGIADTAHIYRVPAGTLRRWLSEGRLTRHGHHPVKVDLAEVERLIDTRRDKLAKDDEIAVKRHTTSDVKWHRKRATDLAHDGFEASAQLHHLYAEALEKVGR